jgi:hypothetical protein
MQRSSNIPFSPYYGISTAQIQLTLNAGNAERQLWRLDPMSRAYQQVENVCHALLAISGIGTVLYSVIVFLH